jgi:hypothetical protein
LTGARSRVLGDVSGRDGEESELPVVDGDRERGASEALGTNVTGHPAACPADLCGQSTNHRPGRRDVPSGP